MTRPLETTAMKIKNIKGRRLAVAAIGLVAFGAASAASLGGLASTNLGSNDAVIAACDSNGVSLAYTTSYDATASKYQVTSVTLSGIAAGCAGQTAAVTVKGTGGASVANASTTVAGTSDTMALSVPVAAENVLGASVVISG